MISRITTASPDWAFLDTLSDGVYGIDRDGHCTFVNRAAVRMLGYTQAEDLIGRNMHETIHHTHGDGSAFSSDVCPVLQTLTTNQPAKLSGELLWRRDGTSFSAEYSAFPISNGGDEASGSIVVFNDDSVPNEAKKKLAIRQARENEARFRTMANGIPQMSWMTDPQGAIVWYNQRWYDYTGSTLVEMSGWGWKAVHHPDHVERVERRFRHSVEIGQDWEDTFPIRGRDGEYNWFLSRAMPIRDEPDEAHPEGRVLGWFGTNTDITAIRDAEQKLERARDEAEAANRAKSTFIANMSHELRTPLSAIIGYAEMLTEEIEEGTQPADIARDVGKIEGNARHLLGLINDVLDLSKVESGKMEAYSEAFDVATMTEDLASTVSALMDKKSNRLELRVDDDVGTMFSDVTRLRQVLLNLLGNAAKFTENGTITLAAQRDTRAKGGDRIRFSVTDTGIGMTEEQVAKLFQRFQQADASTTRQFGGTGLGLALTKAFAELLGGSISVTSKAGEGSTFEVTLPVTLGEQPSEPTEASLREQEDVAGREIVLVVDDDETQRELMSRFLAREGYAARTAHDGASGLALAKRLKPRAILLDVTMPGMDGWSVLSALKADPDLAAIPVVMVTFVTERALASSLGAADYVIKPVDWSRLRHVMESFRDAEGDVLIVDDEEDARHRARIALEKNGWSVVEAANGLEGLDHVSRSVPRVILLDLNMPMMDGFDFLKELRSKPGCGDIPVVVLTALDLTAEDRRRLRGANQVLNKGDISMRDLADKLRRLGSGTVAMA